MLRGAALTRRYVEEDCVKAYVAGRVAYARDAFAGLDLMDKIVTGRFDAHLDEVRRRSEGWPVNQTHKLGCAADPKPLRPVDVEEIRLRRAELTRNVPVPEPPFWGSRTIERVPPKAVVPYLNKRMLYQFQWGSRKEGGAPPNTGNGPRTNSAPYCDGCSISRSARRSLSRKRPTAIGAVPPKGTT